MSDIGERKTRRDLVSLSPRTSSFSAPLDADARAAFARAASAAPSTPPKYADAPRSAAHAKSAEPHATRDATSATCTPTVHDEPSAAHSNESASSMSRVPALSTEKTSRSVASARPAPGSAGASAHASSGG